MKLPRRRRLLYLSRITNTIGFAIALAAPTASDAAEIKVVDNPCDEPHANRTRGRVPTH